MSSCLSTRRPLPLSPPFKNRALSITSVAAVLCAACLLCLTTAAVAQPTTNTKQVSKMSTSASDPRSTNTLDRGCIVRGPRDKKVLALEFTGGYFAEGGDVILATLKKHGIKGSFFFIGDFYREPKFADLIKRIHADGHYLGPHSDKHPLYATWENPPKLQITKAEFNKDLDDNMAEIAKFGISAKDARFFIPPFEHYTQEISDWTTERDMVLMNYTGGTRSNADYMQDDDPKFVSSAAMIKSILDYEKKDPDGLNGFLLLTHIGAGPGRTKDKLFNHLDELITELKNRGYSFVRVDELLSPRE
jgi:peptidoglycan/xylan/chitin deacetylase (PgdA/CDA1 family)